MNGSCHAADALNWYILVHIRTHSIVWKHILTYEQVVSCSRRIELIYIGTYQNTFYGVRTYSNIWTGHVTQPTRQTHWIDIHVYIHQNAFYCVKTYLNIWTGHVTQPTKQTYWIEIYIFTYIRTHSMVWERILTYERVMSRSRRSRRIESIYIYLHISEHILWCENVF